MTPLQTPLLLVSDLTGEVLGVDPTDVASAPRLRSYIVTASNYLELHCNRSFGERIETRYYTARQLRSGGSLYGVELWLDDDLRALTTLTNGDGATISSTDYTLLPKHPDLNGVVYKHTVRLNPYGPSYWRMGGAIDPVQAISVLGTWGYGGQWLATGATVSGAHTDSVTTLDVSAGALEPGMVLKIDSEYLYVSDTVDENSYTVTRAYNGSTAASHSNGATVYRWYALELVQALVKRLVIYQIERVKAPLFGSAVIGDIVLPIDTSGLPKDFFLMANTLKRATLPMGV